MALVQLLIVEDDPGDSRYLELTLEEISRRGGIGFDISRASSTTEAHQMLQSFSPDAILLDLRLPDSDGVDSVRRVKSAADSTPIVVISGQGDEAMALHALQVGADDYVVKGFYDERSLLRAISFAMARHLTSLEVMPSLALAQRELDMLAVDTVFHNGDGSVKEDATAWRGLQVALEDIVEGALTERAFAVERTTEGLIDALAARLVDLSATPKDVTDLYTQVLRAKVSDAPAGRVEAYIAEGRLILLGLLGQLAEGYRVRAKGR